MEILHALELIRSPILDTIFGLITMLGEETIAIVALCLIYWCLNKRTAYVIGVTYFLSGLLVQGMKICFRIDRPWLIDPTLQPVPSALEKATGYSFPSGHTQGATALFGSLAVQLKQVWAKLACIVVVLLVAFSRMYLGVHTLLDVGVSLIVTTIIILIVAKLLDKQDIDKKREGMLAIFLLSCSAVVILTASVLFINGLIAQVYMMDCLKAAGASVGFATGMFIERVYIDFSVKTKNLAWQAVKFVLGIAGVLLIKEGLKLVIGTGFVVDTLRYFLISTWVTVAFPLIIKRFFAEKEEKKPA